MAILTINIGFTKSNSHNYIFIMCLKPCYTYIVFYVKENIEIYSMLDIDDENMTYVFCIQGYLGYVFELESLITQSV